jgi:pimeloyl-ACP methyl ester carboxylesterase
MDRPVAGGSEGEIASGEVRFHYYDAGEGDIILWLGDRKATSASRDRLAETYRVIALSPLSAESSTPLSIAQAIQGATAALGINRFNLLAENDHSTAALLLALNNPQTVPALALLGPTAISVSTTGPQFPAPLSDMKVPALVAFGTKDTLAPPEMGRLYHDQIPACNVVFVYDAGRAMAEERPEAVAELVSAFFRRHDLFLVRQDSDLLYP